MDVVREIDGKMLKAMFKKATENLLRHKDEINALNVFPVPDGDTGSNMVATMMEGCEYLDRLDDESMENVLKAMKDGTLMGARGNSGVILSQIVRGFAEGYPKGKETLNVRDFIQMLRKAKEVAYNAVMKPVEGTMLTVMRYIYERSHEIYDADSYEELMSWLLRVTDEAVRHSPRMLKKLRDAGVVDAGAKGLYYLFEGMKMAIEGDTEVSFEEIAETPTEEIPAIAMEDLTYQYCTEYIVKVKDGNALSHYQEVKEFLESVGDSVVVVAQDDLLKIHVHTNNPGMVLERLLENGELMKAKIDNMKVQHEHMVKEVEYKEKKKIAVVAVSPGEGLSKIMKSLGADEIVKGGQTMNPSTADIKKAIKRVNAENVFVFPNNPNVILAANQAAEDAESKVFVIPTHTPQECIAALINYDPEMEPEELKEAFEEAMEEVIPLSITVAIRNSKAGGRRIRAGEYMVFEKKDLLSHSFDIVKALSEAFELVGADEKEVLSIFTGSKYSKEDLEKIKDFVSENYPNLEVEVYEGGQPHYPFLMSLE